MKGKVFPIIFTTFIASILYFLIMCQTQYANNEFAIQKLQEANKIYNFSYKQGKEEKTIEYHYKIEDDKAIIVELEDSMLKFNSPRDNLYPTIIDDYEVSVEKYRTFDIKQVALETVFFALIILVISLVFFKIVSNIGIKLEQKKQERLEKKQAKKGNNLF